MKSSTLQKRLQIANDILFYIYRHIETDISIQELSEDLHISKFHMQRVFKEVFEQNIYESIKSIRLQKASSLLLTNRYSTISSVANMCGYTSQSSFIKAFKNRFSMRPKEWRLGGYKEYSLKILEQVSYLPSLNIDFESIVPTIVKQEPIKAYYIRNKGYGKNIKESWQKLYTWALSNEIEEYTQIALFHDNPTVTPVDECHYVAAIATKKDILTQRLPQFYIYGGVYAKFDFLGQKGDILHFIHWVNHTWLLRNEYETSTKPAYAIYHKNGYLSDGLFSVSFYLPIAY